MSIRLRYSEMISRVLVPTFKIISGYTCTKSLQVLSGPGRFGRQLSSTDFYIPYHTTPSHERLRPYTDSAHLLTREPDCFRLLDAALDLNTDVTAKHTAIEMRVSVARKTTKSINNKKAED